MESGRGSKIEGEMDVEKRRKQMKWRGERENKIHIYSGSIS